MLLSEIELVGAQRRRVARGSLLVLCLLCCFRALAAQDPPNPQMSAPPPLKTIPRDERTELDQTQDSKARVRRTIELAEIHLGLAEQHTTALQYDLASNELGKYQALLEDVLHLLTGMSPERTKTRDLYKRIELALRAHGPRLTAMRRITPLEYAVWIKETEDFARHGRTEALNSFYGQTVVRDGQQSPVLGKPVERRSKEVPPLENKQP